MWKTKYSSDRDVVVKFWIQKMTIEVLIETCIRIRFDRNVCFLEDGNKQHHQIRCFFLPTPRSPFFLSFCRSERTTKANNFVLSHFASHLEWARKHNTQQYMKQFLRSFFCCHRETDFILFAGSFHAISLLNQSTRCSLFSASDCLCLDGYLLSFQVSYFSIAGNWIEVSSVLYLHHGNTFHESKAMLLSFQAICVFLCQLSIELWNYNK